MEAVAEVGAQHGAAIFKGSTHADLCLQPAFAAQSVIDIHQKTKSETKPKQ